jgi:hypothetical protein
MVYFANDDTCEGAVQGETNPHAQGAQRAWRQRALVLAGLILEQSSARRQIGLAVISQIAFAVMFFGRSEPAEHYRRSTSDALGELEYHF